MAYIQVKDLNKSLNKIYSQDSTDKYTLRITFDDVELEDADEYCEKVNIKHRIMDYGSKNFSLNSLVSKEAEIVLHNLDLSILKGKVKLWLDMPVQAYENGETKEGTEIEVNDLDNTKEDIFEYYGDTYQQTYSGKNLFDEAEYARLNSSYYSFSINNGLILLQQDNRAFTNVGLNINASPNTKYYFKRGSAVSYVISEYNSNNGWLKNDNLSTNVSEFTTTNTCAYFKIKCSQQGLTTPYNLGNIMISTEDIPYQPINAPSPDYPQEVQTVSGLQVVSDTGKNLIDTVPINNIDFNYSQQCTTEYILDTDINKTVLHISSTNQYPTVRYTLNKRLDKNKYYCLKFKYKYITDDLSGVIQENAWIAPSTSANVWDNLSIFTGTYLKSNDTTALTQPSNTYRDKVIRIKIDETKYDNNANSYAYMLLSLGYGQYSGNLINKDFYISDMMIYEITEEEYNDEQYTGIDYEEYKSQEFKINLRGINIFDKSTITNNYRIGSNGDLYSDTGYFLTDYIEVKPNVVYTGNTVFTLYYNRIAFYDKDKNRIGVNDGLNLYSFTPPANTKYVRFGKEKAQLDTFMLVEGTEVPETYISYREPIELCKIGDNQDFIDGTVDDWYINKYVGKVVLNGSETGWYTEAKTYRLGNLDGKPFSSFSADNPYALSDYFKWQNGSSSIYVYGSFWYILNGTVLAFQKDETLNLNNFKTWLSTHNTTVYYILATPTRTKITDNELVSQLNALAQAELYNGYNNITVSGDLPIYLKFNYNHLSEITDHIPLGVFNIQNKPTTDKDKTTITIRDNAVLLDYPYDAKPLMDENDGTATKLQIFQDICTKFNIDTDIEDFANSSDEVGIYDNTINARAYIKYLAEQAGCIASFDRDGKLIFVNILDLYEWELPFDLIEKYEDGDKYIISRVVYEDAIRKYENGDETNDTLYLDSSNPYISSQEQVEDIADETIGFEVNSLTTGKIVGNPLIDGYDLITFTDDIKEQDFTTLASYELTYSGVLRNTFDTEIGLEKRTENVSLQGEASFRKYAKTNIDNINNNITMIVGEQNEQSEQITQITQDVNNIQNLFQITGGSNLIKNSQGLLEDEVWSTTTGSTFVKGYDAELVGKTVSVAKLGISNGTLSTTSNNIENLQIGTRYTLNYLITNEEDTETTVRLIGNSTIYEKTFDEACEFQEEVFEFIADTTHYTLEIESSSTYDNFAYIYDLMLNAGDKKAWEPASGEIVGTVIQLSQMGLRITCTGADIASLMTAQGFQIRRFQNGQLYEIITEFTSNGIVTKNIDYTSDNMDGLIHKSISSSGVKKYISYIGGGN